MQAQNFRFGIHFSPTFNWISTTQPDTESKLDLNYSIGLLAEFDLTERYSVATGMDIIWRGGRLIAQDTLGDYTSNFVQIPLTLKMRTREFGYITYFANFGGALGIEVAERTTISPALSQNEELTSYVSPFTAMFVIGGGAEYSLGGNTRLVLGVNYNRSLIDNLRDEDPRLDESYYYRFDYVELSLGIIF